MEKDIIKIGLKAEVVNIDEIEQQIKELQNKLSNMKINLTVKEDEEKLPSAISIHEVLKKYENAEVCDFVKFDIINDINDELLYQASQGNSQVEVKVWGHRLTSREKDYISKAYELYSVRFYVRTEWSEALSKYREYDIVRVLFN